MFLHLGKRGKKKKHIDIGNKYVLQEEIIKQYIWPVLLETAQLKEVAICMYKYDTYIDI